MADTTDTIKPTLSFQRDKADPVGSAAASKSAFYALLAVLLFAVAFGGGGSKYGLANLIVQLAALTALAFHREAFFNFWKSAPLLLRVLIALSIALPLAYVIPLPPSVWQNMPGRELVAQSFGLVGEPGWAALSVDPIRTMLALSALVVPLAVVTIGWRASRDSLILAGWLIVGLALVNFALGIPQVLSNSEVGVLYPENPMPGVLFGTFANRNSTGLFLVSALSLASFLPVPPRFHSIALPLRIGIMLFLIVAILLTRSRTALVLAALPLGLLALQMLLERLNRRPGAKSTGAKAALFGLIPIALVLVVIAGLAAAAPGRIGDVADRFTSGGEDARSYIWEDAAYAADRYWPVGSGTGTFDDVFQIDESLENMTLRKAGRAHNDYLELAIETGLPGLALAAFWLCLIGWLCWRARTEPHRWIAWSGGAILAVVALQSITDYPLRNMSMLAVAGFALCLLGRFTPDASSSRKQEILP